VLATADEASNSRQTKFIPHVRFWHKADIARLSSDVRF
jgi:hypothetical protein